VEKVVKKDFYNRVMLFLAQKNRIKAKAQSIDFLWRYHFINFSMIFADERANGIPPPGCTLPPQK
jgi:hypothetical protein